MTDEGQKNDAGKPKWHLLPFKGAELVVQVMEHGADKYGEDNWRLGFRRERLLNAAMRHLIADMQGEPTDTDSNLPHLAHAAANLLMLIELSLTQS